MTIFIWGLSISVYLWLATPVISQTGLFSGGDLTSFQIGPRLQKLMATSSPFLNTASTIAPDSGFVIHAGEIQINRVRRIAEVSLWGNSLNRGEIVKDSEFTRAGHRFWSWHGSWLEDAPQYGNCGLEWDYWDKDGEKLDNGSIYICDEYCAYPADNLDVFPKIDVHTDSTGITISWNLLSGASQYGVLIWSKKPDPYNILAHLVFWSGPIDSVPSNGFHFPNPETEDFYVAVWAKSVNSIEGGCERYPHPVIHPRFVLEAIEVSIGDHPTVLIQESWGYLKHQMANKNKKNRKESIPRPLTSR